MPCLRRFALLGTLLFAIPALAQSGLKLPDRGEPGLDPTFARGWLAPEYDRFGFAAFQWRDAYGFAPAPRMQWSYAIGERGSLSMSLANNGRESELDHRPVSVFGRYWFSPDWAVSAESLSRDATGLLRLQDFRIGVQRRF
ncbi:MAG TPA: hypothetical protein VM183_20940 [Burkholderiales bacterium]|nr:hypothetical protein [Burkholderiales bacterium]